MSKWYLKRGDSEVGPGSEDQIKAAFKKGVLSLDSLVRRDGENDWKALRDSGILSEDEANPFVVASTQRGPESPSARAVNPSPGPAKPIIHASMFKEKPRYGRRSAPVYATFADRFVALLIDSIILWIAWSVFLQIFSGLFIYGRFGTALVISYVTQILVYGAYFVVLQHEWGYTLGRKIMGIHVELSDRSQPDIRTFLVRFASSLLSGLILGLGYFLALSDPKMQTLHDRMANTIVVKD